MGIFVRDAGLLAEDIEIDGVNPAEVVMEGITVHPVFYETSALDPDTYVNDDFRDEINKNVGNHAPLVDVVGNGWVPLINTEDQLLCRFGGVLNAGSRSTQYPLLGWHARSQEKLVRTEHVIDITGMSAVDPGRPINRSRAVFFGDPADIFRSTVIFMADTVTGHYNGIQCREDGIYVRKVTAGTSLLLLESVTWEPDIQYIVSDVRYDTALNQVRVDVQVYGLDNALIQSINVGWTPHSPSVGVSFNFVGIELSDRSSVGCASFRASPVGA